MAALMSRLWLLRGCGLEALALLEAAAIPPDAFRLRVLASLGLHATFIEVSNRSNPPARLAAALGRARLETGDKAGALPVLLQALGRRSGWGAWLDAATALAAIDPERPAHALRGREREPVAALLLAHLAERAGDAGRAVAYLRAIGAAAGFQAEAGLLRANIAAGAVRSRSVRGAGRNRDRADGLGHHRRVRRRIHHRRLGSLAAPAKLGKSRGHPGR
jgi:hypothetical protein